MDNMELARRTFTLEFKADVVRHRKAENLSLIDAGKAFDVLPKLVKDWATVFDARKLTGAAGWRTVSPEEAAHRPAALRAIAAEDGESGTKKNAAAQPLARAVAASLARACEVRLY